MTPVFRHGRLRLYLLRLLDEEPRHGYEVIRLLRDRFMGVYAPSPGTIYPRLARLEEEGLVTHDEENGRKVYRITDAGREELRKRGAELNELEQELSASVSDIVREVREDVRETVRSLREELTKAAREMRAAQAGYAASPWAADEVTAAAESPGPGGDPGARPNGTPLLDPDAESPRIPGEGPRAADSGASQPGGDREQPRSPREAWQQARQPLGSAWAQAREQARLMREQAKHAREHVRQTRDEAFGHAQRLREEAASLREDFARGGAGAGHDWGGWHSWGDWANWADWPGRKSWPGPGPHDLTAFRDLERLAREFVGDLRKVAWDSGALGGDVLGNLHVILDETLDRIRTEVFGPSAPPDDPGGHHSDD
jgi:DNA-binding PadR family transcriptional regulator